MFDIKLNSDLLLLFSVIQTAVNFSLKDFGANFGQALASNKHLALTKLDLSRNSLEDKGIDFSLIWR